MTAVLKVIVVLLKWLGILVLGLLGLILLAVLLGLLAPVRYRAKLKKREAPEEVLFADGLVSWLNPLVRVRIRYTDKKLSYTVRLLGIAILNSEKPKKEKSEKKRRKDSREDSVKKEETAELPESVPETVENTWTETDSEEKPQDAFREGENEAESGDSVKENTEKESFFVKIKKFFEKVKAFPGKIKKKVTHFIDTIKLLWHKKEKVVLFLQDELHKQALGRGWNTVKKLFRHILPGKIKGQLEFGTGDPESTGKALGVLGVLYAWYGKGITIVPDFYEKRVVADLTLKGRIRFGTVLLMGLGLIRDKQVKRFIKNGKKLMKVLKQKAEEREA